MSGPGPSEETRHTPATRSKKSRELSYALTVRCAHYTVTKCFNLQRDLWRCGTVRNLLLVSHSEVARGWRTKKDIGKNREEQGMHGEFRDGMKGAHDDV